MSWEVRQTRRFARSYKRLHDNVAADVDAAIEAVGPHENFYRDLKR